MENYTQPYCFGKREGRIEVCINTMPQALIEHNDQFIPKSGRAMLKGTAKIQVLHLRLYRPRLAC